MQEVVGSTPIFSTRKFNSLQMKSAACLLTITCPLFFALLLSSCTKSGSNNNNSNPTMPQVLGTPIALAAVNVSDTSFIAAWHEIYFHFFVCCRRQLCHPARLQPAIDLIGSATITGLNNGTPYYYKVKAVNASGAGSASNTIKLTTFQPTDDALVIIGDTTGTVYAQRGYRARV